MILKSNFFTILIGLFCLFLQLQKCYCTIEKENKHSEHENTNKKLQEKGKHVEKKEEPKHSQHQFYQLFRECAVKERIKPGEKASVLYTINEYSRMRQIDRTLFFSLSNKVYIGDKHLANKCVEDKHAKTVYAKFIDNTKCKKGEKEGITHLKYTYNQKNKPKYLSLQKNSEGKCVRNHFVNTKGAHHFEFFECNGVHCGGVKMVLVERDGKHNGIRSVFYSKSAHSISCLEANKCGERKVLKGVFPPLKNEKGAKLKQNKLFQECAIKRGNNIETLVKYVELSEKQILFFSKGEHVYYSHQQNVKVNCEKDKAAKMKVPIQHVKLLLLKNGKIIWKNYQDFNLNKKSIGVKIEPNEHIHNKHCSALANNHFYQIFLCQKEVCGTQKLYLMRKKETNNKNDKLIKMDEGEKVHLAHIFIADLHHSESKVIEEIIKKCQGTEHIINGVSYPLPNSGNKQHPNNKNQQHPNNHKNNEPNKKQHNEHEEKGGENSKQHNEHKDKSNVHEHSQQEHDEHNNKMVERKGRINSEHEKQKHQNENSKQHSEQINKHSDKSKQHNEEINKHEDKSNVHEHSKQKDDESKMVVERNGRKDTLHNSEKNEENQKSSHQNVEHSNKKEEKKNEGNNIEGILKSEAVKELKKNLLGGAPI